MKGRIALSALCLLILPVAVLAETDTESVAREVEAAIHANLAHMRQNLESDRDSLSEDGSDDFWSNGGPMRWTDPSAAPDEFEVFELTAKDVKVIPLADGAAVALYYAQGSLKPGGRPLVPDYHTRVTGVYVKEDGRWKQRAIHYSPVAGSSGTSHTADPATKPSDE